MWASRRQAHLDAPAAADPDGHVAAVSLGSAPTLLARVRALLRSKRLVVADLPGGARGLAELRALAAARAPGELLLVVQRTRRAAAQRCCGQPPRGLPGGGGRELSSQTTQQRGLIASVDIAPTILAHLGAGRFPPTMRGKPLETDGSAGLRRRCAR